MADEDVMPMNGFDAQIIQLLSNHSKDGIVMPVMNHVVDEAMKQHIQQIQQHHQLQQNQHCAKRGREDVTSRSRAEIIRWVLDSEELTKVCVCPYCLKIHSRRDNARVHMKNQHKGLPIREFVVNVDASIEEITVDVVGVCGQTADACGPSMIHGDPVASGALHAVSSPRPSSLLRNPIHLIRSLNYSESSYSKYSAQLCPRTPMSHVALYSEPTAEKEIIKCKFCEKVYKVNHGSSGFIRHLRCKHPNMIGSFLDDEFTRMHDVVKKPRLDEKPIIDGTLYSEMFMPVVSMEDQLGTFLLDIDRRSKEIDDLKTEKEAGSSLLEPPQSDRNSRDNTPSSSIVASEIPDQSRNSGSPNRPFGCVGCPCSYNKLKDLVHHVTSLHRTFYRCNSCLAEFVKPEHLEMHYYSTHSGT
ncbi:unnamed protein product [Caenorhabditis bovis]|uniref:C2H2-type domain-containing protein n=1 Tax=Caenorhabditis bovis TaxID=2654633 RepID=A0A8S1EXD1_9PELO|nr:unnamed protein product [Caenorhabditis bovis]